MRCVTDFWGNCTGVASNRHDYRWRYVRPRQPAAPSCAKAPRPGRTLRRKIASRSVRKAPQRETHAQARYRRQDREKAVAARQGFAAREREVQLARTCQPAPASQLARQPPFPRPQDAAREIPLRRDARTIANGLHAREKASASRDNTTTADKHHHLSRPTARRRRRASSQDDARRAAENGWIGAVRYDYGERYQDINRAKDVRLSCGPSSVSAALKTPHYRCAVEATPCRGTVGQPDRA